MALARQVGVHETTVGRWVAGRRLPDLDMQVKLAAALDTPVDELFPRCLP